MDKMKKINVKKAREFLWENIAEELERIYLK